MRCEGHLSLPDTLPALSFLLIWVYTASLLNAVKATVVPVAADDDDDDDDDRASPEIDAI